MWKKIVAIILLSVLVILVIYNNFPSLFSNEANNEPNMFDVTGDTSIDGEYIVAPNKEMLKEGMQAPDFSLSSLHSDELVSLSNFSKEYIVLNFWATWCKPCTEEMPDLQKLKETYESKVDVIALNITSMESKVENIKKFIKDGNFTMDVLLDTDGQTYEQYSVINVPSTFFIRKSDYTIVKRVNGMMTYAQMEDHLEGIFNENKSS